MILVGVDGSPGSRAALVWALEEARLRNSTVRALHAWKVPVMPAPTIGFALAVVRNADEAEEYEGLARRLLDETVDAVVAEDDPGVGIQRVVREGAATEVLLAAAVDAELLVVGSRGLGGFKELLLGSVSHQCALHAPCPVVIVREVEK